MSDALALETKTGTMKATAQSAVVPIISRIDSKNRRPVGNAVSPDAAGRHRGISMPGNQYVL